MIVHVRFIAFPAVGPTPWYGDLLESVLGQHTHPHHDAQPLLPRRHRRFHGGFGMTTHRLARNILPPTLAVWRAWHPGPQAKRTCMAPKGARHCLRDTPRRP